MLLSANALGASGVGKTSGAQGSSAGTSGSGPSPEPATGPSERLAGLRVFRREYYARFRPRTALDVVLQTPGFELALGAAQRGLE